MDMITTLETPVESDVTIRWAPPPEIEALQIGVIGLGYVGLPLAAAYAQHWPTVGFDIEAARVEELSNGTDRTLQVKRETLLKLHRLRMTHREVDLV